MEYKIEVNNSEYRITDTEASDIDIIETGDGTFHLLKDNQAYNIEVVNTNGKYITLSVNGNIHHVDISDSYDQLIDKMGLSKVVAQKLTEIKAPMPGLVLDVLVSADQEIAEGDPLVILEAMKMENVLKATGVGEVKSIEVKNGDAVEKGQILIEMK